MDEEALVEQIQNLLPQTQCERCGHAGCLPYAQALARGQAAINQCPPGGQAGVEALANLLGRPVLPLDPRFGQEGPLELVEIEEDHCIGCTLCIQACPVDAIVGAPKQMHTVLTELCTGCQLCVAPCPVDCIVVRPAPFGWDRARARSARARFEGRARRLLERAAALRARTAPEAHHRAMRHALDAGMADIPNAPDPPDAGAAERKRAVLARALARARARTRAQELSERRKELEAHASAPASRIEPD